MSLKARLGRIAEPAPRREDLRVPEPDRRPGVDYLSETFLALKARVQQRLLEQDDELESLDRDQLKMLIAAILADERALSPVERDSVVTILTNEIKGFGPIQPLLDDPEITEVMVNGPSRIFIERNGKIAATRITFRDEQHLKNVLEKMLAPTGRRLDESSPMVDARLPDGSRLNAVIRPIAVSGDTITIRKFSRDPLTLPQLARMGTLSPAMVEFLEAAVRGRLSIVVSGGTGS